eukprot:GHVT01101245.1.p1 GENE.GHVT01101245.1~~GHVT01101245.1.p1  ORF type:complete len:138 (-),score=27.27 GHVT01101245.1:431-844(-)
MNRRRIFTKFVLPYLLYLEEISLLLYNMLNEAEAGADDSEGSSEPEAVDRPAHVFSLRSPALDDSSAQFPTPRDSVPLHTAADGERPAADRVAARAAKKARRPLAHRLALEPKIPSLKTLKSRLLPPNPNTSTLPHA